MTRTESFRKLDADRTMQLISPRKVQHWAKSYKDRAARLIDEGRMAARPRATSPTREPSPVGFGGAASPS